jgi:hypothetical protein
MRTSGLYTSLLENLKLLKEQQRIGVISYKAKIPEPILPYKGWRRFYRSPKALYRIPFKWNSPFSKVVRPWMSYLLMKTKALVYDIIDEYSRTKDPVLLKYYGKSFESLHPQIRCGGTYSFSRAYKKALTIIRSFGFDVKPTEEQSTVKVETVIRPESPAVDSISTPTDISEARILRDRVTIRGQTYISLDEVGHFVVLEDNIVTYTEALMSIEEVESDVDQEDPDYDCKSYEPCTLRHVANDEIVFKPRHAPGIPVDDIPLGTISNIDLILSLKTDTISDRNRREADINRFLRQYVSFIFRKKPTIEEVRGAHLAAIEEDYLNNLDEYDPYGFYADL